MGRELQGKRTIVSFYSHAPGYRRVRSFYSHTPGCHGFFENLLTNRLYGIIIVLYKKYNRERSTVYGVEIG